MEGEGRHLGEDRLPRLAKLATSPPCRHHQLDKFAVSSHLLHIYLWLLMLCNQINGDWRVRLLFFVFGKMTFWFW